MPDAEFGSENMQADASGAGRDFAVRTAEIVSTAQGNMDEAPVFARDLRVRAEAVGRPAGAIRILPGVNPVIGRTEADAKARIAVLPRCWPSGRIGTACR